MDFIKKIVDSITPKQTVVASSVHDWEVGVPSEPIPYHSAESRYKNYGEKVRECAPRYDIYSGPAMPDAPANPRSWQQKELSKIIRNGSRGDDIAVRLAIRSQQREKEADVRAYNHNARSIGWIWEEELKASEDSVWHEIDHMHHPIKKLN